MGQFQLVSVSGIYVLFIEYSCVFTNSGICSDIPPLMNGVISYNDAIATHSCNTGYTLTGDSVRVCQNDRTWSGSTPTCQGEDNQNSTC